MTWPNEQGERPTSVQRGAATRDDILAAAAALIGELGWGRVSTRAIAERAGVPHGAVSYHFRGKRELLREAAVAGLRDVFDNATAPAARPGGVAALLSATLAWYESDSLDDPFTGLLTETLREAVHDEWVAGRMRDMLADYRSRLVELVRDDQRGGAVTSDVSAEGLAVLLAALLDGLMFHARVDPGLSLTAVAADLGTLLAGPSGAGAESGRP